MWSDWLTPLRWLYRGVMLALMSTVFLLPTVLCQGRLGRAVRVGRRNLAVFMMNTWSGAMCRTFGIRCRVWGAPLDGPVLIVANHISWLAIQVMHSVAAMSFVAKAEIDDWPLFGYVAGKGGTVYHRRGSHDSALGVVEQMLEILRSGGRAAIFPEGGILPGAHVKHFHARMFRLAIESPCPVQPAMIRYVRGGERDNEATFIRGESFIGNMLRLLGRPAGWVELSFLEPFEAEGRQRRELAELAHARVVAAFEAPVSGVNEK